MKALLLILISTYSSLVASFAQDIQPMTEQQLENLADVDQAETEDDSYMQQLERLKKHPLNLDDASANELTGLLYLNDLQIDNLISYRKLFGRFLSIYELQAIPAWDVLTIKKILPYITIANSASLSFSVGQRLHGGENRLLLRFSELLERPRGFDRSLMGAKYSGGKERIFFRYRYQFKDLLQYGIAGDKDAGEQFLKGRQKYGFDFYSLHFFLRKIGRIKALALGDFSVNMGQGLIQWQSLAFKKSADITAIKRQSAILRPYTSSGEFYFNRGAGVTMQFGSIETTFFASSRKLDASLVTDTITNEVHISSVLNSGYHRTQSEIDNRNNFNQFSFGGNLTYRKGSGHIAANAVCYDFSFPLQKTDRPYNLYAITGTSWSNFSIDYSYTFRNIHFFGEAASDKNLSKAFLNGILISADPKVDISIVQRAIDKEYQAVYGNAFTESTYPTNENGIFAGVTIRPAVGWHIDMYADFCRFPWLRYVSDAPGYGKDFLVQISYAPNKQVEIYSRFRTEVKQTNNPDNGTIMNFTVPIPRQGWRTQVNFKTGKTFNLRNRIELLWYGRSNRGAENGFLTFFDIICKPPLKPFSGNIRLQYFETNGYNSRIYAFENDVLYNFSIPAFFDKGFRYYLNFDYDLQRNLSVWLRCARTIYKGVHTIGSGLDQINGNHRTEIKLQIQWIF